MHRRTAHPGGDNASVKPIMSGLTNSDHLTASAAPRGGIRARGFRPSKPKPLPPYDHSSRERLFWTIVEEELAAGRKIGSASDSRGLTDFLNRLNVRNDATPRLHRWPRGSISSLVTELILNADLFSADSKLVQLHCRYRRQSPKVETPSREERVAAAEAERVAREQLRQVMAILGVSYKRAYVIMREGTGLADQARRLAIQIEGTTASDWMRAKSRPGRRAPPIAETLLCVPIDGCSMLDFTEAVLSDDELRYASDAFRWVDERYRMREPLPKSFATMDDLTIALPTSIPRRQIHQLWCRFKAWRADRITAALELDVLTSELADRA